MKFLGVILFSLILMTPMLAQDGGHRNGHDGKRTDKIEALKIAFLTKELELTPEESQQFWPIYNQHQAEMKALRKDARPGKTINEMSDSEAEDALQKMFAMQENKLRLEQETMMKLKPILGAKRVLKLTKAEGKFKRKVLEKAGKRQEKSRKGERKRERMGNRIP